MFVAAQEFIYKPYKYLFTRIKSNDNLYAGLSSFEVEMSSDIGSQFFAKFRNLSAKTTKKLYKYPRTIHFSFVLKP